MADCRLYPAAELGLHTTQAGNPGVQPWKEHARLLGKSGVEEELEFPLLFALPLRRKI